ncbi:hypothetical protein ACFFKE_12895 [Streptomyces mutabilis]|uniref:hypothetical protein n=1 Tax=Streptomyces mutabilis TaxID=67332 RepID=UPI001786085B|nr:hypothetical protein [Streptomyces mutabilis]GGQ29609.1 hypothetical protein GCM10010279_42080 [Streptomyces mutabilis]
MIEPTYDGVKRKPKGGYVAIRGAIRRAESLAYEALPTGHPTAHEIHAALTEALEIVDAVLFPAGGCAGPECTNPVPDKGMGRPALYCSRRCKDRAAYRARKERGQRKSGAAS